MTDFNLSEKIAGYDPMTQIVVLGDVKEFIRLLKEEISFTMNNSDFNEEMIMYDIDKLAGEKFKELEK